MEPVVFFSAERVNQRYGLADSLARVLARHHYVLGPEVAAFEREFAQWCGVEHAVGVANGSDALEIALRALQLPAGSSVVLAANAGFYGSTALAQLGLKANYVDVDPVTLTLDPRAVERALLSSTPKPAALLVTHLYGSLADMPQLSELARQHGIPLIEDCAQAHGAERNGIRAGAWGDIACFSFYPTKNLGALGDGGAVLTHHAALADRVRALRQYGWGLKYHVDKAGGRNSRLDELQAAVLRDKLPGLEDDNEARRAIAFRYTAALSDLPLMLPRVDGPHHVVHLYVIRTERRDALMAALRRQGIASDVHYPVPDHQQPVVPTGLSPQLPHTEAACTQVLSLPCYPGLPLAEQQRVIDAIRAFFV